MRRKSEVPAPVPGATAWRPGVAPVAVVMISLNEAHNMQDVLNNLAGWAQQVFLVDSCSADDTVSIALRHGVQVVQRRFRGFGDQWNFALRELPITAPWTMKIDPDERLSEELKSEIARVVNQDRVAAFRVPIRLYFMGSELPNVLRMTRLWRTGSVQFTDVTVNEHARCTGAEGDLSAEIQHLDSPSLDHWMTKQNRYTTAEASAQYEGRSMAAHPRLLGSALERRMWLKRNFWRMPGRYVALFIYHLIVVHAWRTGRVGWIWARLRTEVYRIWEYKRYEMERLGRVPIKVPDHAGEPDPRVRFYD
jgi:hypothetical protein